ncbi:MAG: DUF4386 domain-containing protein, partial [Chitinophagaceae bacterium]|nr:DUF4386 domain-containing protein [Chitinophagaceae bacterium]
LIVSGDATATAHNIIASQSLWRIGIALDLLQHVCDVGLLIVFYVLFKPVSRNLTLLAILFAAIKTAALIATKLNQWQALFPLGNENYLQSFNPQQLHTLMYLSIRADQYGFGIGLIFFGFACLVLGYLIYKSEFLPKLIGVLIAIAGVCYIINSFALILAPRLGSTLFPAIMVPPFIAETSFCLWLIIKGVNASKWRERATHGEQLFAVQ